MSDLRECQVFVDERPRSGSANMSIDEALLDEAVSRGLCAARVYEWSEATVSLGYFQQAANSAVPSLAALPCVRRLSGGGAILHHHELTYSCTVPASHPLAREPQLLYESVHASIIVLLARWGILARQRGTAEPQKDALYLCFGRGDSRDIMAAGQKIVGSAQRRRKGAVLQHGSLLLQRSPHAAEFPGILDLFHNCRMPEHPNQELAAAVGQVLGRPVFFESLGASILQRAEVLEKARYSTIDWRNSPA